MEDAEFSRRRLLVQVQLKYSHMVDSTVERVFSAMNCVKTKARNRMGLQLIMSILLIRGCFFWGRNILSNLGSI
jgi:hypothetical protein